MSRIGKQPVIIPDGVSVEIGKDLVSVTGPKGSLSQPLLEGIDVKQTDDHLIIERLNEDQITKAKHGLFRSLLNNMVIGVSTGFIKKLEINGVGYRVSLNGQILKLNVGLSHDVTYNIPSGINVAVDQNRITVSGIDKQQVGQVAAEIRAIKKPEPYKGKGIKYENEHIIRKSGKSGKEK